MIEKKNTMQSCQIYILAFPPPLGSDPATPQRYAPDSDDCNDAAASGTERNADGRVSIACKSKEAGESCSSP